MTKCPVVGKDRIAELYPHVNEEDMPLPRSWITQDRCTYIGLSQNNLRAHYKGTLLALNMPAQNGVIFCDMGLKGPALYVYL